jgi:parallel beta-helix repeat protein
MKRTTINAMIALGLGWVLTLVGMRLLSAGPRVVHAQGPDGYSTYYVAPSCTGVPVPCYTTLQAAVDAADDPEDVIKVAAGIYTDVHSRTAPVGYNGPSIINQVVYISKNVSIQGGYTTAFSDPPDPKANPITLDAQGRGRVLFISGSISPTIEGLSITGGDATGLDGSPWRRDGCGGGVYIITATATLRNNRVFSNTAEDGSGLYLLKSDTTLSGNIVTSNRASLTGGGLYLWFSNATFSGNTVDSNTAVYGGGLYSVLGDVTLNDNIIISNTTYTSGGGLLIASGAAMLNGNTITGNIAGYDGGGISTGQSKLTLIGNIVTENTADYGGGLDLLISTVTLTNNIVANNQVGIAGGGLYICGSSSRLLHTTITRNRGGDGSGIHVAETWNAYSTVALTNTILVSHTLGITVAAGNTATLEATLWGSGTWANGADGGGAGTIVTGTHNYWGDPAFVNPDAGDYHIGPGSAALDRGVDIGVTLDVDGDPRPIGAGYDLGADEFSTVVSTENFLYLPLVLRQSS